MHNFRKEITLKENSFNFSLLFIKVNAYRVEKLKSAYRKMGLHLAVLRYFYIYYRYKY